jgi:hypothetical protein
MEYVSGETLSNSDSLRALGAAEKYGCKYDNSLGNSAFATISCGIKY